MRKYFVSVAVLSLLLAVVSQQMQARPAFPCVSISNVHVSTGPAAGGGCYRNVSFKLTIGCGPHTVSRYYGSISYGSCNVQVPDGGDWTTPWPEWISNVLNCQWNGSTAHWDITVGNGLGGHIGADGVIEEDGTNLLTISQGFLEDLANDVSIE